VVALALVLSACSAPGENASSSNTNSSPTQNNSNSAPQPSGAQIGAPIGVPSPAPPNAQTVPAPAQPNAQPNPEPAQPSVQPIPAPAQSSVQPTPAPAPVDKAAAQNSNSATAASAPNGPAPKLVLSDKKIDYGKQDQGKTLVRAIAVKNGGKSNLNIESVVPS
jgi:hypothetical protein